MGDAEEQRVDRVVSFSLTPQGRPARSAARWAELPGLGAEAHLSGLASDQL
jgi:hypothetical protein